jgi:hypothetical protein
MRYLYKWYSSWALQVPTMILIDDIQVIKSTAAVRFELEVVVGSGVTNGDQGRSSSFASGKLGALL